jgi:hypothetical protein
MEDVIISVDILPEVLHRRIRSEKVKVQEADGIVSLIPLESAENENNINFEELSKYFGIAKGGTFDKSDKEMLAERLVEKYDSLA